jgi:hypothetical protein
VNICRPARLARPARRACPARPARPASPRLFVVAVLLATSIAARAADREPTLSDVLARVGDYVVRYENELSGIVAEEHYSQVGDISDRPHLTKRELKSDLLLVRAEGTDGEGFIQFRDVFEVDGDAVRDRSERLVKLFMNPTAAAKDRASEIMRESSRYNIGSIDRNVNVPVLALSFMHPRYQPHFKFTMDVAGAGVPKGMPRASNFAIAVDVRVLSFREVGSPPLIDSRDRRGAARSQGRVWVEPDTGRVLMTEITIETPSVDSTTHVSYQSEPLLGFLVPVEMREEYRIRKRNYRLSGTATYGNFRQFTVQTNEAIVPPKDQP